MGGTIGIRTHLFEYFELSFYGTGIYGGAEGTEVMVHTDAVEFQRLAVERESFGWVEVEISEPGAGLIGIYGLVGKDDVCHHFVEFW